MTKGFHHKETIWEENDKEIKALLTSRLTVKDIWKDNRRKINYLLQMNIDDARVWFGYRSKMTVRVKANRSSEYRNNIGRRHCNTNKIESQEHL